MLPQLLKAFGINVPPETVAQIEALIPQIPSHLQQATRVINSTIQNFDKRLAAIETRLDRMETLLDAGRNRAIITDNGRKADTNGA